MANRFFEDDRNALPFLPYDAAFMRVDEVSGWHYSIVDPYGDQAEFFIWHDGRFYQVSLVDPPLEAIEDASDVRLTRDGRLQPMGSEGYENIFHGFLASIAWQAYRSIKVQSGCSHRPAAASTYQSSTQT